jgi:hypothetical protein
MYDAIGGKCFTALSTVSTTTNLPPEASEQPVMAGFRLPGEGVEEILSPVDAGAAEAVDLEGVSLCKALEDSGRGPATARTVVENEALKNPLRDELTRIKMAQLARRYPRARRTRFRNDPGGGVYAFLA